MTKIDNKNNFLQTIKNVGYADTKWNNILKILCHWIKMNVLAHKSP